MHSCTIPAEWKSSITIPIFKKGTKTDPKNYRGICLLNTTLKLLTKIIAEKITGQVGICEEQQGFRRNRSTVDAIFIMRQIFEKAIEFNKPAYICFIDLTQAFDRIKLSDVLNILERKNVDPNIIKLVEELNTSNKTRILVNNKLTPEIPISSGIRQGDTLSPILFNIIMDQIIENVKTIKGGYRMGDSTLKIICYADDAAIIAENEDDLQRLLYKFNTTAARFNMEISVGKTKAMTVSKEPIRCKLAINNDIVEQVMSFTYLGVVLSSDRNTYKEVRTQATKAATVSGYLKDIVWRNKYITNASKVRIYKTCVRPILTYAIESRAETHRTKQVLRTTERKTLRAICGISLLDHVRSDEIRRQCNIQDVVRWSRVRRRKWNQHVNRMDDHRIAKIVLKENPDQKRPQGRPPKRWKECWTSTSQEAN